MHALIHPLKFKKCHKHSQTQNRCHARSAFFILFGRFLNYTTLYICHFMWRVLWNQSYCQNNDICSWTYLNIVWVSFDSIHRLAKRGTPTQMSHYKHALQLFKLHNSTTMTEDWVSLNFQQNFNGGNDNVQIFNSSNYKVGENLLVNRFKTLSNKIPLSWLNESINSFKIKCKNLFL